MPLSPLFLGRHCLGTVEDIKMHVWIYVVKLLKITCSLKLNSLLKTCSFELQSITTHMEHLEAIEDNPSQSHEFGVNHESLLMEIEYFDICSGVLISNVMHDLFEGVLQYETKLMLIQFIGLH